MTSFCVPCRRYARTCRGQRSVPASAREDADAIIIYPAGFSFTLPGMMDAIKAFEGTVATAEVTDAITRPQKILELLKADQQAA